MEEMAINCVACGIVIEIDEEYGNFWKEKKVCKDCSMKGVKILMRSIEENNAVVRCLARDNPQYLKGLVTGICRNIKVPFPKEGISRQGWTPLHHSVTEYTAAQEETVKILLDFGADPNACDSTGNTPLTLACQQACAGDSWKDVSNIVSILLKAGGNPNTYDGSGNTCLIAATKNGDYPVVKALMEGGAKKSLETRNGYNNFDAQTHAEFLYTGKAGILRMKFKSAQEETHEACSRYEKVYDLLSGYPDDYDEESDSDDDEGNEEKQSTDENEGRNSEKEVQSKENRENSAPKEDTKDEESDDGVKIMESPTIIEMVAYLSNDIPSRINAARRKEFTDVMGKLVSKWKAQDAGEAIIESSKRPASVVSPQSTAESKKQKKATVN